MTLVTLEIPDELAAQFDTIQELRRTLYEDFIIEQRQQGPLSLGEAATLLDLTYAEFFMLLGKKVYPSSMSSQQRCRSVIHAFVK